jgi:hypothetical protein
MGQISPSGTHDSKSRSDQSSHAAIRRGARPNLSKLLLWSHERGQFSALSGSKTVIASWLTDLAPAKLCHSV